MAEDLTDYLTELGLKVKYIHSEIDTFERVEILKSLRTGEIDVLIGTTMVPSLHGKQMGKQWKQCQTLFFWAPKSLQM